MRELENLARYLVEKPKSKNINKPQFAPSHFYMDFVKIHKEPIKLIHITNKKHNILIEGFRNCVSDYTKLGLTKWLGGKYRGDTGYVFCFPEKSPHINDALDKYGNQAVSFTAPCVIVNHYNDQEVQAITHTSLIGRISDHLLE